MARYRWPIIYNVGIGVGEGGDPDPADRARGGLDAPVGAAGRPRGEHAGGERHQQAGVLHIRLRGGVDQQPGRDIRAAGAAPRAGPAHSMVINSRGV